MSQLTGVERVRAYLSLSTRYMSYSLFVLSLYVLYNEAYPLHPLDNPVLFAVNVSFVAGSAYFVYWIQFAVMRRILGFSAAAEFFVWLVAPILVVWWLWARLGLDPTVLAVVAPWIWIAEVPYSAPLEEALLRLESSGVELTDAEADLVRRNARRTVGRDFELALRDGDDNEAILRVSVTDYNVRERGASLTQDLTVQGTLTIAALGEEPQRRAVSVFNENIFFPTNPSLILELNSGEVAVAIKLDVVGSAPLPVTVNEGLMETFALRQVGTLDPLSSVGRILQVPESADMHAPNLSEVVANLGRAVFEPAWDPSTLGFHWRGV